MDLAVAGGTLALAGGTFWMARATRDMAVVAQRQFDQSVTPVVRVARLGQPNEVDALIVHSAKGAVLQVVLENMGPAPAEVERCVMSPFGAGRVVDPDQRFSPVLQPGDTRDFEFPLSESARQALADRERLALRITYMAVASGGRFSAMTYLQSAPESEPWLLLGEQAPHAING